MSIPGLPDVVRRRALASGEGAWLDALPALVAELEREWSITVGPPLAGGSEALVAPVTFADGSSAILKLLLPSSKDAARHEITVLRLANGEGCARLLRDDAARGALLLERLGAPLDSLGLPLEQQHDVLCAVAMRLWRPAAGSGLPTGAEKGRWLVDFIRSAWQVDRPCSERAVDYALACVERRIAAHDDERAVLVHGDIHRLNTLRAGDGFKLIDPDGLLAEAEYDLGVLIREDPLELIDGDPRARARRLAERTGRDATAIWEWGVVERVSTGLVCTKLDLPDARELLAVAERVVE